MSGIESMSERRSRSRSRSESRGRSTSRSESRSRSRSRSRGSAHYGRHAKTSNKREKDVDFKMKYRKSKGVLNVIDMTLQTCQVMHSEFRYRLDNDSNRFFTYYNDRNTGFIEFEKESLPSRITVVQDGIMNQDFEIRSDNMALIGIDLLHLIS